MEKGLMYSGRRSHPFISRYPGPAGTVIVLCPATFTLLSAQTTVHVSSVSELRAAMENSNQHIIMEPGKYKMSNGFSLSGSSNTVDLTGAYFYWTVGDMRGNHLSVTGSGNTVRGGEFEDVYFDGTTEITDFTAYNLDRDNFANGGETNVVIDGDDNRIVGLKMTVRGSYPYGYGSMYGINQYNTFGLAKTYG